MDENLFSNTGLGVLLFAIWSAFALGFSVRADMDLSQCASVVGVLFLSYLFFVLLIELWALYRPDSEKIAILLAVIAIVYLILPLICAGIFENELLFIGSPIGLFVYLVDNHPMHERILRSNELLILVIYHVALCAIPAIKIIQQWSRIRETRVLINQNPNLG